MIWRTRRVRAGTRGSGVRLRWNGQTVRWVARPRFAEVAIARRQPVLGVPRAIPSATR